MSQVGYTINGQPIEPTQIDLMERAIQCGLAIDTSDIVLDLCCGNGLITYRIAAVAKRVYGVDFSRSLIEVARHHFTRPNLAYLCRPVTELRPTDLKGDRIGKAYMSSALQHFTRRSTGLLMDTMRMLSEPLFPIYFTNVPDVDHLFDFYNTPERVADYYRGRVAGADPIGTWWNKQDLADLISRYGYVVEIVPQDPARFGAHYRFDLLAKPC